MIRHKIKMLKEFIIKQIANHFFSRYGKMLKLDLDSKQKKFFVEILPKGESSSIRIEGEYDLVSVPSPGIRLRNINTSREWMTELARAFIPDVIEFDQAKYLGIIL